MLTLPRKKYITSSGKVIFRGGDPIYEIADPFADFYVRKIKISSNQEHVLRLARLDAVLIDGGGTEHEVITANDLEQSILAKWPCPSGKGVLAATKSVKVLGKDTRIRPGRSVELHVLFSGVDKSVLGDWTLELLDFPVATNEAGEVKRVTSFQFPLRVEGQRSIIKEKKEGFLSPWVEMSRDVHNIE